MEENEPKISVIVPMYNAEKYLELCISTILNQSFKDFELILVDDCSTDKTLEIAKSFSDSRIKILCNEKNLGAPGAVRNIGIDAAKGEYIYFCDDDDMILKEGLEKLYNAVKDNADVVNATCWYITKDSDSQTLKKFKVNLVKFSKASPVSSNLKTRIYQEFLQNRMHIAPWLFLYRRKFLIENNIKFPDETAEDVFFNFDVICATSKIIKIDFPHYVHRIYKDSTTYSPKRIQKNIQAVWKLNEHIEEELSKFNDANFTRKVSMYWTNHVIGTYVLPFISNASEEILQDILNALEPRFEKNSSFVLTLLQVYSQMRLANAKNKNLLEKSEAENKKLKTALENIQKQITKVTKA